MRRPAIVACIAGLLFAGFVTAFVVTGIAQPARPHTFAGRCSAPVPMLFYVESEIRRDVLGLTQGLQKHGDFLFESTGLIAGDTRLMTIEDSGRVTVLANFGNSFFGEGLTILGERIFQLTWRENIVFVYDLTGKLLRSMHNPRDGWGLTNDGAHLIFTDGGDRLYYADPENFEIVHSVQVRAGDTPLHALNELEYIDGKIYANIFMSRTIVRVDLETGCVEAVADLNHLWARMSAEDRAHLNSNSNFVLNGIAYDQGREIFYLTGKNWKTIYTGRFADAN